MPVYQNGSVVIEPPTVNPDDFEKGCLGYFKEYLREGVSSLCPSKKKCSCLITAIFLLLIFGWIAEMRSALETFRVKPSVDLPLPNTTTEGIIFSTEPALWVD